jgi:hypothetical protein
MPFPWVGEEAKKPEIERALRLNVKVKLDGVVEMGHEWFFIYNNADGS